MLVMIASLVLTYGLTFLLNAWRQPVQMQGPPPIFWAIKNGDIAAVKAHILAGGNINEQEPTYGWTLLICALAARQLEIALWLIGNRADVRIASHNGTTALHVAAETGNVVAAAIS